MSAFGVKRTLKTLEITIFNDRFRHGAVIGKIDCRLAQPLLFRQRHLELDGRQLLGGFADALQERQPARVGMNVGEQGFDCNLTGRIKTR